MDWRNPPFQMANALINPCRSRISIFQLEELWIWHGHISEGEHSQGCEGLFCALARRQELAELSVELGVERGRGGSPTCHRTL